MDMEMDIEKLRKHACQIILLCGHWAVRVAFSMPKKKEVQVTKSVIILSQVCQWLNLHINQQLASSTVIIWLAGMPLEILAQVGKSKKAKNYKFVAACQLAVLIL
jgi:hypothetical protein